MDPINHILDFDLYSDQDQNAGIVAEEHPINDGSDLRGQGTSDLSQGIGQTFDFMNSSSQMLSMPPSSDSQYFEGTFDLFSDINFDDDATGLASQPIQLDFQPLQPTTLRNHNEEMGLVFDSELPAVPDLSMPTIAAAAGFDETLVYPPIMPGSSNGRPQWQSFANQQPHIVQPQSQATQFQLGQLQAVEDPLHLGLQSTSQPPTEAQSVQVPQSSSDSGSFPSYQPSQASSQVMGSPQGQSSPHNLSLLSFEQIELLANAEPVEHTHSPAQKPARQAARHVRSPSSSSSSSSDEEPATKASRSRKTTLKRTARNTRRASYSSKEPQHRSSPPAISSNLTFASLHDAEEAMALRYIEANWSPPSPDNTIPKTQRQRAEYVLMMFEAFQDTSICKDNVKGFSFVKRWLYGDYYNLQEMEKVCWHLLDIAEGLHVQGPSASNVYCGDALKRLKGSRGLTFEQRIHAICAMLKFSKSLCDNLMKGEGLEALVGTPVQKMSGAKTMMVQNKRRQKWIVHGRSEDPLHTSLPGSKDQDSSDDEDPEPSLRNDQDKSKQYRSASKPKSKMKTDLTHVSDEDSEVEDEVDVLERRQSASSLRRRSADASNIADKPTGNALEGFASPKPAPKPRTTAASTRRNLPSHSATSAVPDVPLKTLPPRHTSPRVRIPRTEIEAARFRSDRRQEADATGETTAKGLALTKAKLESASRKRVNDQAQSESESGEARPSKKRREEPRPRRFLFSSTRKTRDAIHSYGFDHKHPRETTKATQGTSKDKEGTETGEIDKELAQPSLVDKRKMYKAPTRRTIEMTATRPTKPAKKMARSAKPGPHESVSPKSNKRKRRIHEDPEPEQEPESTKRAKKTEDPVTRKSARIAAKHISAAGAV